jgi:chromate reductase
MTHKIAVIVGSLRKESFNRKMALTLMELAPKSVAMEIIEIGQLPLYNQDFDESPPAAWVAFREQVKQFDGVLLVTPEYNRSFPAALKNALDVGSRPYGQSVWDSKPAAVISVSVGAIGGFGANHHLRQILMYLNMPTLQQPEAYIGNAGNMFDADGKVGDEKTRGFLQKFIDAYAAWVATHIKK